jgi:hypothetical protein
MHPATGWRMSSSFLSDTRADASCAAFICISSAPGINSVAAEREGRESPGARRKRKGAVSKEA